MHLPTEFLKAIIVGIFFLSLFIRLICYATMSVWNLYFTLYNFLLWIIKDNKPIFISTKNTNIFTKLMISLIIIVIKLLSILSDKSNGITIMQIHINK